MGMSEQDKREKVVRGLECCKMPFSKCYDGGCPYFEDEGCKAKLKREALELLKAQGPIEARLHLCDSCKNTYPECGATHDGVAFGCGVGKDNVIGCNAYVNRWKASTVEAIPIDFIKYRIGLAAKNGFFRSCEALSFTLIAWELTGEAWEKELGAKHESVEH